MPLPRSLAHANRHVTNRLLGGVARYAPGFGVVHHTGRTSHRAYRTPVNVFRHAGHYTIALTYGSDADWVRNVLAAGGCRLETRGRLHALAQPRLFHDSQRQAVPAPVRLILGFARVDDFLELAAISDAPAQRGSDSSEGTTRERERQALRTTLMHAGNRVVRQFAGRHVYALLAHRGRRSGRPYATPVVAWLVPDGIVVPLPYGVTTDWYRNVLAADGCEVQLYGRWYAATTPRVIPRAAAVTYLAPAARTLTRLLPIQDYVLLRRCTSSAAARG